LSKSTAEPGLLILVVGPSGAGKDSLIEAARPRLDDRFVFARREITRPADAGGEAHLEIDRQAFEAKVARGGYALWWRAHELFYGLDAAILTDIDAGRRVVANGSRAALDEARRRFARLRVVSVTADASVIARRLARRGREGAQAVEARLARGEAFSVVGDDVVTVANNGALDDAAEAFAAALRL